MGQDAFTSKGPRRWLKSVIVLLVGLAYLGGVYWASPSLRKEMRLKGVWYGWPFLQPPPPGYRVRNDRSLRGFEKRLIERAESTQRVRMTMDVTQRWRVKSIHHVGDPARECEEISPLRERRYKVTLLMEPGGSGDEARRVRLLIEEGDSWSAWVFDGSQGWYLLSDTTSYPAQDARRRLGTWSVFSSVTDELRPVEENKMVPLWPFVDPDAFTDFLSGTCVRPGAKGNLNGTPCRIVRVERLWRKSGLEVCKLWMPEGEDRVVKVEYAPAWSPDLIEKLTPDERAELGTFCVVTSYEEPQSFADEEFDPGPLLERWAVSATHSVEQDLQKLKERRRPMFLDDSGTGFGGGFGDESEPDGFGTGFGGEFGDEPGLESRKEGPEE